MNVQEVINIARQLPLAEQRQVLSALEANFRANQRPSPNQTDETLTTAEVRRRRMEWLKANREAYGGNYVVLDEDRLLGTARSYREGRELALSLGVADAFVDYLSKPDEMGEMGGW